MLKIQVWVWYVSHLAPPLFSVISYTILFNQICCFQCHLLVLSTIEPWCSCGCPTGLSLTRVIPLYCFTILPVIPSALWLNRKVFQHLVHMFWHVEPWCSCGHFRIESGSCHFMTLFPPFPCVVSFPLCSDMLSHCAHVGDAGLLVIFFTLWLNKRCFFSEPCWMPQVRV